MIVRIPNSLQIVVRHSSAHLAGKRTFWITFGSTPRGKREFSASCPGFGESEFHDSPIAAVLALIASNGGTEALTR